MAEQNKDHLADALAALSAGEHHEPDPHDHEATPTPAPLPRQTAPKPVGGQRPSAPVVKPIASIRPTAPSTPVPQGRPIAAARPAAPAPAPAPLKSRPVIPAANIPASARTPSPTVAAPSDFVAQDEPVETPLPAENENEWMGTTPVDDDTMMAPAPDASAFTAQSMSYKSPAARMAKTSDLKPTLIPILLTTGMLFLLFSLLKFVRGADSPYAALPGWVVGMVAGMGGILLAFAVFTMMQVKEQLTRTKRLS